MFFVKVEGGVFQILWSMASHNVDNMDLKFFLAKSLLKRYVKKGTLQAFKSVILLNLDLKNISDPCYGLRGMPYIKRFIFGELSF